MDATNARPKTDFLANPYALRDWMRGTPEGRRLIHLYEQHSPELVRIVLTNSTLLNDAAGVFAEFIPGLNRFLAGQADAEEIRPDMIERLNRVWDAFAAVGSPELKTVLAAERTRLDGFQDFAGRTFGDWGQLLAIGVPASPFLTLSSPQRTNQVFFAEANRVEGLAYTLQRSPPVSPLNWTDVTNASIRLFDYRVELTDTNAAGVSWMYRLRAKETSASR